MSKAKLLFAAGFAVLAFSAPSVSTASAAWDVNGTLLVGTAALANALVLSFGKLNSAGVEIQCQAHEIEIKNGFIREPDELLAESLAFHSCKILNETGTNCKLSSEVISTLPIHGLAVLDEGKALNTLILILPLPTKTFSVLKYEGEKCALLGVQPITAAKNPAIDLLVHEGGVPLLLHLVLAFSLKESLHLGSNEATLEGLDADIRLANDQTWAFL